MIKLKRRFSTKKGDYTKINIRHFRERYWDVDKYIPITEKEEGNKWYGRIKLNII